MDDIPPRSYGPLIEAALRIITWNVWGLYGPWREREAAIIAALRDAHPDIVVLAEASRPKRIKPPCPVWR